MMSDPAHEETEAILKALEKRITKEYIQAQKEIQAELDEYLRRFETKDKIWQKWVEEGKETPKAYNEWRIGQMAIGKRWEEQKEAIARELTNTAELAKRVAYDGMPDVYAANINYATYDAEHKSLIDTQFAVVNRDTAAGILKDRKLYHDPGAETTRRIAEGLEMRWNKEQIQSVMLQAILQGESIGEMATRLSKTVSEKNRKVSIRNVRTMTTGVQNAARVDGYNRAKGKGINLRKQWLATLDGRTRHSHRLLDGEVVDINDKFSNGCMFPGDPDGAAAEVYNCRCTLLSVLKGHEINVQDMSLRNNKLGDMSYKEWLKAKAKSQDILHQDKLGESYKTSYINEYKGLNLL